MRWLGGGPNFVRNPLPPGFEPTGVGAHGPGFFRDPRYPARIGELAPRVHAGGGLLSVQMVLQGGMPIAPSTTLSSYADHRIPHALDLDEVQWLIREYGESAAIAIDAGVDAIEIHANHDDVVQWFLSPLTNRRDDEYGGSAERRRRFLREIVEAIRVHARAAGHARAAALPRRDDRRRLRRRRVRGGGGRVHGRRHRRLLQPRRRQQLGRPELRPDRLVRRPPMGAAVRAGEGGHQPARRLRRARARRRPGRSGARRRPRRHRGHGARHDGRSRHRGQDPRRCRGPGASLHRAQRVHPPQAGRGPRLRLRGQPPVRPRSRAGTAAAATRRARCWSSEVVRPAPSWRRCAPNAATTSSCGSATAISAGRSPSPRWPGPTAATRTGSTTRPVAWRAAGVRVVLGREATADDVLAAGCRRGGGGHRSDAAPTRRRRESSSPTSSRSPTPSTGTVALGPNVVVVVEDDGPAPLSVADHLAGLGHHVTLVYQTSGLAPLVGKYSSGAMYARLINGGVTLVPLARLVGVEARHRPAGVHLRRAPMVDRRRRPRRAGLRFDPGRRPLPRPEASPPGRPPAR